MIQLCKNRIDGLERLVTSQAESIGSLVAAQALEIQALDIQALEIQSGAWQAEPEPDQNIYKSSNLAGDAEQRT